MFSLCYLLFLCKYPPAFATTGGKTAYIILYTCARSFFNKAGHLFLLCKLRKVALRSFARPKLKASKIARPLSSMLQSAFISSPVMS